MSTTESYTAARSAPAAGGAPKPARSGSRAGAKTDRLLSVDAYRGFVMLAMASDGLGLRAVKDRNPNWAGIAAQFDHVNWEGCVFWDLIQPSFMFIVGVSMVMSFAKRQAEGQSWARQGLHAVKRAALLCLVGMFLDWYGDGGIYFQLMRVLQQIAIGYLIAFAVLPMGPKVQGVTALLLLVMHTAAYLIYGQFADVDPWNGMPAWARGQLPTGDPNFGQRLDMLIGVELSRNRYVTFNAISSAATILFGVLTGELLRSPASHGKKLGVLVLAGAAGLASGWVLSGAGGLIPDRYSIPLVKKIWTASFALFAAGWTCWMLAAFYAVIEGLQFKWWSFPFVVVGMNSIAMYVLASMFKRPALGIANLIVPPSVLPSDPEARARILANRRLCDLVPVIDFSNWQIHWGIDLSRWYLTPFLESMIALTILWLAVYWLYRNRIFFKL